MTAPLATLIFLTTIWFVAKLVVDCIAEDGAKIVAALRGRSLIAQPAQPLRQFSVRYQPRAGSVRRPVRAAATWRDAA